MLPPTTTQTDESSAAPLWTALWRLLAVCLVLLMGSSLGELVGRTVAMSGLPLAGSLPVLPTVLCRTHYGRVWRVRCSYETARRVSCQ